METYEPPGNPSLTVELDGNRVVLQFDCAHRYSAIELYDRFVAEARRSGALDLRLTGLRHRKVES